ncbi:MAG: hypothetical protein M3Y91_04845 [Actinomycetota bacterium]|nr:hypothetical protein [Actinomycetota bacterium]
MVDDAAHPDLVTLVEGGGNASERSRLERHLLACDLCWAAVRDDRSGRLAVEDLREAAPATLRDRIVGATETSGATRCRHSRAPRRPRHRQATVAAVTAIVLAAAGAVTLRPLGSRDGGRDPTIISAVDRLAGSPRKHPVPSALHDAGQRASISATTSEGATVIVARSATPFAMPAGAVPMTSATSPWVARRGQVTLVCFNTPRPILVASLLAPDRLIPLARSLDTPSP